MNKKKVIIFDDDEDILYVCSHLLEEKGWEVHIFADTSNILKRVRAIKPNVVIMDNWIPDNGGLQQLKN